MEPEEVFDLELTDNPSQSDLAVVSSGLNTFNAAQGISHLKSPIAVFVRDNENNILAGLYGNTAWDWLHIRWLWVDETLRGAGMAGKLLAAAEDQALKRNCHGAYIDTFSPPALRVYQRAGYQIFGQLEDFPLGRTRTFLKKQLSPPQRQKT